MARSMSSATAGVERTARGAATSPGGILFIRIGYLAKGLVFLIIGLLAGRVALGNGGGGNVDRKSALHAIYNQPFGQFLLWVVALGLIAYALFSLARAAIDLDGEGSKPGAVVKRIGYAAVAISYGAFAIAAARLVMGTGSGGKGSNASTQDWTRRLLDQPFGVWLVVLAGLIVLAFAFSQFGSAYKASFEKHLDLSGAGQTLRRWIVYCGRFGKAARGVVFAEIGFFLIVAALRHNNKDAMGLGGALAELARQPYGHVLLGLVALGFVAYGLFSFAEARYRALPRS